MNSYSWEEAVWIELNDKKELETLINVGNHAQSLGIATKFKDDNTKPVNTQAQHKET